MMHSPAMLPLMRLPDEAAVALFPPASINGHDRALTMRALAAADSTEPGRSSSSERRREPRPDFGVWLGARYGVNNLSLDLTGRWKWIALNAGAGNILHAWSPDDEIVRRRTDEPTVGERFHGHVLYAHLLLIQEVMRGILVYAGAGIAWRNETEVQRSLVTGLYHEPVETFSTERWASGMAGLEMRLTPSFSVGAGYGITQGWGIHLGYYSDWFGSSSER